MSAIVRPTYYEAQILGAADLEAQLQYGRAALARHERLQHSYGVVCGLEVSLANEALIVATGMLIDGTGRQVVLPQGATVTADQFQNFGIVSQNDREDTWYPVFISGVDTPQRPSPFRLEQCNARSASRIDESWEVSFGRPGSEAVQQPPAPTVDSAPSGAAGVQSWPIVVGFVQWSRTDLKFKDAKSAPDDKHRPRYAGVYADSVVARGGSLSVRTRVAVEAGKPAMLLQDEPWQFQVGKLKPNGGLEPLLTLNDAGDLEVAGKLKGTLAGGSVVAESGLVSDGVTIPLPAGVTAQQVSAGKAQICVMLSPRIDQRDAPTSTDLWAGFVLECRVDENRRAHCRVRWYPLKNTSGTAVTQDRSASFAYLITASLKQE
ncbi:hypothetical protein [Paraburkholderia terrae]